MSEPEFSIGEVEELLAPITLGEWQSDTFAVYGANRELAAHTGGCERTNEKRIANATFIAAAPSLARQLVRVMKENEELKAGIEKLGHTLVESGGFQR